MYLGDYALGATVHGWFPTRLATGARGDPSSALETSDIRVYAGASDTERASQSGYVVTSTKDSMTGIVYWSVDLSDNTTAGFFKTPGVEYAVVFYPDETIDSLAVSSVVATFSVGRPSALMPVVGMAQGGSTTTVQLPSTASSTDGAYAGASVVLVYDDGSIEACGQGTTAYVGSSRTFTLDRTLGTTVASTTRVFLFLGAPQGTVLPDVNVAQVNDTVVTGTGTSGDPWGPV